MHKINKTRFLLLAFLYVYALPGGYLYSYQSSDSATGRLSVQKVVLKIDDPSNADSYITHYLRDVYPLISEEAVNSILSEKIINKFLTNDTLGIVDFYAVIYVPKYFLDPAPKILWELNLPAFQSYLFQIYEGDTILIDIWPNVIGKPSTKTYTGYYQAFRLRNWPFWKDPESGDSVKPTPPGPNNPLGLFVVHYDENSLRYFHGTNKNYLLKNEYRALSHGCVRNDNGNIAKMKEFIIKKVIKSDDLTSWLGSKSSLTYEIKDEDRFPVRIIYKTFDINEDEIGDYIIFYQDVYNYSRSNASLSNFDDLSLITTTNFQNVYSEFRQKHPSIIPDEKLIPILEKLISAHKDYQKYYFYDLVSESNMN
jgi:L,D-transpeptidase-like protein